VITIKDISMYLRQKLSRWLLLFSFLLILTNCGGGGADNSAVASSGNTVSTNTDPFAQSEYKGLTFYHKNMPASEYRLPQLDDTAFNALTTTQKERVADKLLSTLFFGYPYQTLKAKIDSGTFISDIRNGLTEERTDKAWLENYIIDGDIFRQTDYNEQVAVDILTRLYAMKELDSYFLKNWVAYILTQTIMFSPAYELESTHTPNIARVYNRLVTMLDVDSGMRYITYVHMMSEDNWRRFRSPEDNGREMLEIFALDSDDSHVPIAAKALQNWKLDRDSDTLVVSLNQNREPLHLFGTTIYNGDDFYRELVKSPAFTQGVTKRLVDFFFPASNTGERTQIVQSIVNSKPETWQDILLQIVFSQTYLLHTERPKSAEELFYSIAKKTEFKHRTGTFHELKDALEAMHQATMKYKLGKLKRVPLDTLSFANYHKYIRERMLLRKSNPDKTDQYDAWDRQGWDEHFLDDSNFDLDETDAVKSLESLIQYLFHAMLSRDAQPDELTLFKEHMIRDINNSDPGRVLDYQFNILYTHTDPDRQRKRREARKRDVAIIVLDYISRLAETYTQSEVK
jgi:hypothetical protein